VNDASDGIPPFGSKLTGISSIIVSTPCAPLSGAVHLASICSVPVATVVPVTHTLTWPLRELAAVFVDELFVVTTAFTRKGADAELTLAM
jgi:hypothetical protein